MRGLLFFPLFLTITILLSTPTTPLVVPATGGNSSDNHNQIPSPYTSTLLARRLFLLTLHGTLSTTFPASSSPPHLQNHPIGLPDYTASCDPDDKSNPTLLALPIATSFRNALTPGSNISLSLQWVPPPSRKGKEKKSNGEPHPASLPRLSILGHLERIPPPHRGVERCFTTAHPDARGWVPGNRIHESVWVRLVVKDVYWVGGFGDRAWIGWISGEKWRGVTEREIEGVRLPGEEVEGEEEEEGKGWVRWLSAWIGGEL
ncbi:hypothetical protein FGG08_001156 [Glutinoglossum americanum]|uniref:CREG-like beta-barrel domain-containing protein n=1 Tax=Glutinoglossum americanum TaxID=1670608 RepID=A0A9P8I2F2_9PEZI|nr:hypothetical protein FGG08_001156 [Glutinoglossum americanum]